MFLQRRPRCVPTLETCSVLCWACSPTHTPRSRPLSGKVTFCVSQEKHHVLGQKLLGDRSAEHVEVRLVHNVLNDPLKRAAPARR